MIFTYQFLNDALPLCELLAEHNGILLAGHSHHNTVAKFEKNGKSMRQVTVSTFIQPWPMRKLRIADSGISTEQAKQMFVKKVKLKKEERFLPVFEKQWAPYVTEYRDFSGAGYARFDVSDKGIRVSFQSVDTAQKPLTVQLLSR